MPRAHSTLPFTKRIRRDNLIAMGGSLFLALLVFVMFSLYLSQQRLRTEVSFQASTLAANLADNLDEQLKQTLVLNTSHSPDTLSITIFDKKGLPNMAWNSFTLFTNPHSVAASDLIRQSKSEFHLHQIDVASPIFNGEELVGKVQISTSLSSIYHDILLQFLIGTLVVVAIAGLGSHYLAERQYVHIQPVFEFAKVTEHVVLNKDYSARLPYDLKHELGSLGRNFNQLVTEVETWEATREAEARERDEDERRLNILNNHDSLTKLPNRHYFHRLITNSLEDALATGRLAALVFIDLDHLKNLNDEYGYDAGDLILATITNRLTSVLRSTDTLCRVDGDEFAAILPEVDTPEMAAQLADRLTQAVRHPMTLRGKKVVVTASVGVACCPVHGKEQRLFLHHTDLALRAAKSAGGNTYRLFHPNMNISTLVAATTAATSATSATSAAATT